MDEFWSYVGKKSNQRWTWYALDKSSGIIVAWHNGTRADEDFLHLLNYLESMPIDLYYTDAWGAYSRNLSEQKHIIGKAHTWKIERKNLNFRTHIKRLTRKTIWFSKSQIVHDTGIGMYSARYYFKHGSFSQSASTIHTNRFKT